MEADVLTTEQLEAFRNAVPSIRERFATSCAAQINSGEYDARDLERLRSKDEFVYRYILHNRGVVKDTIDMIDLSLKFRKDMELNDLKESSFPRELHDLGGVFYHNQDKDGHPILYFKVSKCQKDPKAADMVKQFICWWIDKHFLKTPDKKIVVLFDMTDAGIRNVDLDIMKFQVSCFTTYYPALLECMLVFEMPWVLNALWKIIRALLTAKQQKAVKFVKKNDIQEYIAKDKLLKHMGGDDDYEHVYIPQEDSGIGLTHGSAPTSTQGHRDGDHDDSSPSRSPLKRNNKKKHVSFAESASELLFDSLAETANEEPATNLNLMGLIENSRPSPDQQYHKGALLNISPAEALTFYTVDDKKEVIDILSLTNTSYANVAFKVKTTSPDHYRVRPAMGVIKPGQSTSLQVFFYPGHGGEVSKDKFLVMSQEVAGMMSGSKVNELFRGGSPTKSMQHEHRLRCVIEPYERKADRPVQHNAVADMLVMQNHIKDLAKKMDSLLSENRTTQRRMYMVVVGHMLLVLCFAIVITAVALLVYTDHPFISSLHGASYGRPCPYQPSCSRPAPPAS